jgi:hypothetical protein
VGSQLHRAVPGPTRTERAARTRTLCAVSRTTRKRWAIATLVVTAVLIVVEFVALATGQIVVASACAVVFVVGWFVVRAVFGRPTKDETGSSPKD